MPVVEPIIKYAEAQFTVHEIHSPEAALGDPIVHARFLKFAEKLKRIAPKAKDFLYFSAVMMHSAEAALVDQKTGELKTASDGSPITASWEVNDKGSWKWACSDGTLKPYKNNNGDIFPESELKKAYRQWVGRPLCKDHQSSTVDGVRGLVIDTYWDDTRKRVIALCALDRVNYPDLARKVETGYANNVSMGTAVGRSICFECGNVATTEAEYCDCVKGKSAYGEINLDLSPIELSLVVTGADPGAKLRNIVASLSGYSEEKQVRIAELRRAGCVTPGELEKLENEVRVLKGELAAVGRVKLALDGESSNKIRNLMSVIDSPDASPEVKQLANQHLQRELAEDTPPAEMPAAEDAFSTEGPGAEHVDDAPEGKADDAVTVDRPYGMTGTLAMTGGRGGATQDPHSSGPPPWSLDGRESRLASCGGLESQIQLVQGRLNAMEQTLCDLSNGLRVKAGCSSTRHQEDKHMSEAMKERARTRRAMFQKEAYHQGGGGVNDPQTYPVDPGEGQARKQDKQMVGEGMEPGSDGLAGNDLEVKKKLSRAQLEERRLRREALLTSGETKVTTVKSPDGQDIYLAKSDTDPSWRPATKQEVDDHFQKVAYHQGGGGVNDPQTYPVDPGEAAARKQDKQMVGEGMEPGSDGLAGNDLEVKKRVLRASQLSAKFIKVFADASKTDLLKKDSRWEVFADGKKVLEATADQIFGDKLDTYWNHLSSEKYGHEVIRAIRKDGLNRVAYLLTGDMVAQAQDPMPPPPGGSPAPGGAPGGMPEMPEMPEPPEEEGPEATKGAVESALAKVEQAVGDLSDILQEEGKVEGGKEKLPPIEEESKEASDNFRDRILEVRSALDDNGDELALISETLEKRIEAGLASTDETAELMRIAQESLETSDELRSEAGLIVEAKKGKLPPWLEKGKKKGDEEEEEKDDKKDKKDDKKEEKDDKKEDKKEDKKDKKEDKKEEKDKKGDKKDDENGKEAEASAMLNRILKSRASRRREMLRLAMEEPAAVEELAQDVQDLSFEDWAKQEAAEEEEHGEEDNAAYVDDDPMVAELLAELEEEEPLGDEDEEPLGDEEEELVSVEEEEPEMEFEEEAADQMVLDAAQRKAWRESVAAEVGAKYQQQLGPAADVETDMLQRAHPQGGHTLEGLDTNVSEGLDHVERIDEMKKKIMQQVQHLPPVREAVEHVAYLLKKGAMTPADLGDVEKLKALAVDPEAAKYWKQFFGEGDPASSQFGTELVKEFVQKKASQDAEGFRLKMRRAYDIGLEMQDKGLIGQGRPYLEKMVDDIMKFDDKAFEAFKRAMERTERIAKVASKGGTALEVGLQEEPASVGPATLAGQLGRLW